MSEQSTLLEQPIETESQDEAQVDATEGAEAQPEAEAQSEETLLAGKYKSAEDLESAYKSL